MKNIGNYDSDSISDGENMNVLTHIIVP